MGSMSFKFIMVFSFFISVIMIHQYNNYYLFHFVCGFFAVYYALKSEIKEFYKNYVVKNSGVGVEHMPSRVDHDRRRGLTYPEPVTNTWYHVCDSDQLSNGRVLEVRALGLVFAVWRDDAGKPVCQDAFCLHLGANLAVGGKVVDNCLECPFHKWKFASDGSVHEIPYLTNPHECHTNKKLKTFPCVDWCGLVMIYFHADDAEPQFELPAFVAKELEYGGWAPHLKWDIGFKTLSPVDWVDQAGDHAHFATLHADFLIPWTLIPLPEWFQKIVPLGICHKLITFRGDDKEWEERVKATGWGCVDKHLVFFSDVAGLTWNRKPMEATSSQTVEMFVGPAIMVFNIPFTIGALKAFVTTTPTEGGSIMRVRTWYDGRVKASFIKQCIAWVLTGISASQLTADIMILTNKIRQKKPILQPFDGPYNRTNAWLKIFYSESTPNTADFKAYKNDW